MKFRIWYFIVKDGQVLEEKKDENLFAYELDKIIHRLKTKGDIIIKNLVLKSND